MATVTTPLGVDPPPFVTVAVKVTDCSSPNDAEELERASDVVVPVVVTVRACPAETDALKLVSPP